MHLRTVVSRNSPCSGSDCQQQVMLEGLMCTWTLF